MQQGGVVAHIHVVIALHTEGRNVAEQLDPFATIVAHFHAANAVVGIAVAIDAIVFEMRHDFLEYAHMGRENILTLGTVCRRGANKVAVHSHHVQLVVDLVGYLKSGVAGRYFAAALRHANAQAIVGVAQRSEKSVVITIVGVVGIVGLQRNFHTINTRRDVSELDDFRVLDVGRNDNHNRVNLFQIDLRSLIRAADFHLGFVSIRIDDLEGFHHVGSGQPVGVAGLGGLELHNASFARQSQNVAINRGRTFHQLEADGQSRRGRSYKHNRVVESQLVGNVGHLNELSVAVGLLAHEDIVEATRSTLRMEENTVPHLVVLHVAAARRKIHANIGTTCHLDPIASATRLHEHRHGTCAVVGCKVERHLVARPSALLIVEGDVGAIGQAHFGVAAVALGFHEEVNAAIHVVHSRQDVSVAIAVEAHAKERAPPSAVHVDFEVHDAAVLEAEVEVGRGFARGGASYT